MHVDFATCGTCIFHELDGVVEDTGDVFLHMILQVVTLVDHSFGLVVIVTVISCTIHNVGDPDVLEYFSILSD